jgi:hypothetical protein
MSIHDHLDRLMARADRSGSVHVGAYPNDAVSSRSTEALGLIAVCWGAIGGFMYLKGRTRQKR